MLTVVEPAGLREAAISWVQMRTDDGRDPLTRDEIQDFEFSGEQFKLQSTQQGIRKPAEFSAALSIQTVFRRPGQERPYEDLIGDDGLLRYMWRGDDPTFPENVGLRNAMEQQLPLIWFWGVAMQPARFQVIAPVYVVGEEPHEQRFLLTATEPAADISEIDFSAHEYVAKRYLTRMVKVRVHQPVFRATVLTAYENHCAVCNLAHPSLLDAAHIVADREEKGIASVVNGLAMCKIHHAAFDRYFLGVRPDYTVEIRHDLLEEVDGPMLRHGLQELHGQKLMTVPKVRQDRPQADLLKFKYDAFRSATKLDVL